MDKKIIDLLYRSFDSDLSAEEQHLLEQALRESDALKTEKEKITAIRANLALEKEQSFKPFFAERVMNKIQNVSKIQNGEQFFEFILHIFRPFAIAATVLIIIVAGYNVTTSGRFSLDGLLGIPEVTIEDAYDPGLALVVEEE